MRTQEQQQTQTANTELSDSIYFCCLVLTAVLAILLTGCTRTTRDEPIKTDPLWATVVAAHTAGPISRQGEVRVVFSQDVISAERIGKEAEKLLSPDPRLKGKVTWDSARELTFKPSEEFLGGKTYRFELKPLGLKGVPVGIGSYYFDVVVKAPEYEVRVDVLGSQSQASLADAKNQLSLSGEIITADVEANDRVEHILKGEYLNRALTLSWNHTNDGKTHRFSATLPRQNQAEKLTLRWEGNPINASAKGERVIDVPAKQQFTVIGVAPSDDPSDKRIDVTFSDALARTQDLTGLVTLSAGRPRFRIEGNLLRIYVEMNNNIAVEGDVQVRLLANIRNERSETLGKDESHIVSFAGSKPQVRFASIASILPEADRMTIPVEVLGVRAINITAFRVYDTNLPQFLQVNNLDGERELTRVGRNLWRKHIRLSTADNKSLQRWQRYSLDVTELLRKYPGSLLRLNVTFTRADIATECPGVDQKVDDLEAPLKDADTSDQVEYSIWDYADAEYQGESMSWYERDNPCKRAFYAYGQNVRAARNLLVSNIGLLAKRDQFGKLLVVATDLRTAVPLSGVQLDALNYQNQKIASASTNASGMAEFKPNATPYLLVAEKSGQKGYLKIAQGLSLPISHFDVGGEQVVAGLKGFLYGERGVWRPGDDIFLTLAVQDQNKTLPANHPVKLEFFDPRNQLQQTLINDKPVGGFYAFTLKTREDSPTGEWTAKATLGGTTFTKSIRVETVMPNRLKMDLLWQGIENAKTDSIVDASKPLRAQLHSQWLTGALAANLHADVAVRMSKGTTKFSRYADFVFDDPTRELANEPQSLFDGVLDESGHARLDHLLKFEKPAPGMLNATFITRVFEPSGAFSIQRETQTLSPFANYIGIKLPKGDVARNMLLTDTVHTVEIASVNGEGKPVSMQNIEVSVYKIQWRWWWEQSGESLAQYQAVAGIHGALEGKTSTTNGTGKWTFTVNFPEWGRYLVRACDTVGKHCAAQSFYIDWPAWAGRPQDQSGPGANALTLTTDKTDYQVGDVAKIDLPEGAQGRALLTIENGSRILDARWIEASDAKEKSRRIEIPLTAAMTPNVYATVTLIQPHQGKSNDRPLRMYGVVPLKVSDPKTHLQPMLTVPTEWRPETKAIIKVTEAQSRAMNYTLAIVDEGLLGLTNFKTPNLHDQFYKREALGISTWDLFDQVAGAYSADLERLLALGGSDAANADPDKNKSRFPPVVKFIGPYSLAAGKSATHEVLLPKYVGAVRVMLIAGLDNAYGSAEKSVFVRQPLMILPTVPRVVGPNEEVAIPISVFTMDNTIKQVDVTVEGDNHFAIQDGGKATTQFKSMGEQVVLLRMKTAPRLGQGTLKFVAVSGKQRATAEIHLSVRSPNAPSIESELKTLQPGESWTKILKPHGLQGTNTASLEVTSLPPLNLENRLAYLIQYPHGCLEQTTSGAFPQLYLTSIVRLDDARKQEVERNINGGIDRLRLFQQTHGGFSYWPGDQVGYATQSNFDPRASWTTNYAGHFLLEAERLGYHVPASMRSGWLSYQHTAAQAWMPLVGNDNHSMDQAYRLFTLAIANQPEMGAMNRLREVSNLPLTARWLLAAAYHITGGTDAARDLTQNYRINDKAKFKEYNYADELFGSRLRDQALVLMAMTTMGAADSAQPLMRGISEDLNRETWYSTHTTAYGLLALSKFVTTQYVNSNSAIYTYDWQFGGQRKSEKSDAPIATKELGAIPDNDAPLTITNTGKGTLFVRAVSRGIAPPGQSDATASGLAIDVEYAKATGEVLDVSKLTSGTDLIARITVRNNEPFAVKNIALTQMVPAGWEIMNDRLDNVSTQGERDEERYRNDWYYAFYIKSREKTEYLDIRDDRVQRYFSLEAGERVTFVTRLNAAYLGKFWLPGTQVEAMYDAARNARTAGQWVSVSARGEK